MAITAFTSPVNGPWPMGRITVVTAGTPVPINGNVGIQTGNAAQNPPFTNGLRQITVIPTATNTGVLYLLRKAAGVTVSAATTPNFIVGIIPRGAAVSIPNSTALSPALNPDDFVLDGDTSGDSAIIVGLIA